MIPAPDLTFEYFMGILGILTVVTPAGFVFWKYSDNNLGVVAVYGGMAVGFALIILGLHGAVGLADWSDGKVDVWRDQISEEIKETECEDLQSLSLDYKNKNKSDKYTINQIRDEIKDYYVYNCVDTREAWYLD